MLNYGLTQRPGWNTLHGREWRAKLGKLAKECGFADMAGFRKMLGPRWAWHIQGVIENINLDLPCPPKLDLLKATAGQ